LKTNTASVISAGIATSNSTNAMAGVSVALRVNVRAPAPRK
jgi:hypothetical protein